MGMLAGRSRCSVTPQTEIALTESPTTDETLRTRAATLEAQEQLIDTLGIVGRSYPIISHFNSAVAEFLDAHNDARPRAEVDAAFDNLLTTLNAPGLRSFLVNISTAEGRLGGLVSEAMAMIGSEYAEAFNRALLNQPVDPAPPAAGVGTPRTMEAFGSVPPNHQAPVPFQAPPQISNELAEKPSGTQTSDQNASTELLNARDRIIAGTFAAWSDIVASARETMKTAWKSSSTGEAMSQIRELESAVKFPGDEAPGAEARDSSTGPLARELDIAPPPAQETLTAALPSLDTSVLSTAPTPETPSSALNTDLSPRIAPPVREDSSLVRTNRWDVLRLLRR